MRIFSPSQTQAFLRCPYYWQMSREWMPRTFSKMDLYAIRGSAVSVGLDAFNRGQGDDEIIQAITNEIKDEWEKKQMDSREWVDMRSVPLNAEDLLHHALLLVECYINQPPTAFEVIESEYQFRKHGWARADVIGRLPRGQVVPVDYKCKDAPASQWLRQKIIGDFANAWQLLHYCWATSEEFNVECLDYGILLLWYSKTPKVEYVGYTVDPERLSIWLDSATRVWREMTDIRDGRKTLYEVADHDTKFGPCPFKRACLEYNRDLSYMEEHYIQIGR